MKLNRTELLKSSKSTNIYLSCMLLFVIGCSFFWNQVPMSESIRFWEESETVKLALQNTWHPPIYITLLSIFRFVGGDSFIAGYFLGIISVALSALIIVKIVTFYRPEFVSNSLALSAILLGYLSLPAILHGVFIYDIDNTILTPLLLLTFYVYLYYCESKNIKQATLFSVVLIVSLWTKTTTPLVLIGTFGLYHLIRRDFKFLFLNLVPIFLISIIIYFITYRLLYSSFILNGNDSFQWNTGKAIDLLLGKHTFQLSIKQLIFSVASNIGAFFIWSSLLFLIPFLFLSIIFGLKTVKKQYKELTSILSSISLPILFVVATLISYTLILKVQATAGYPKYHYPAYSFIFIILGVTISNANLKLRIKDIITSLFIFILFIFITKDILLSFYESGRVFDLKTLGFELIYYFCVTAIPLTCYFIYRKNTVKSIGDIALVFTIYLALLNTVGFYHRAHAEYSTNYHYGIYGTMDALEYANGISTEKTIHFPYLGLFIRKVEGIKSNAYGRVGENSPTEPQIDYIIISDQMLKSSNYFFNEQYIINKYIRIKNIGSYGVWRLKKSK